MSEIDSVQAEIRNYYNQRTGRNYVRLMDTPRVWGLPFGQAIMPQAWTRQGDYQTALEEVIQKARYRCDLSSLNTPDPDWAGIVIGAMDTALSTRMNRTAPTQFRFLFGQTPLVPIGEPTNYTLFKQALVRLVRDRGHAWERMPDIWLGRFYALREGFLDALQLKVFGADFFGGDGSKMTWNHSKIVVTDGLEAFAGGHNLNMDLFRSYPPVHDVSAIVHGPGAAGAQGYLDQLWAVGGDLLTQEQLDPVKVVWNGRNPAKSRPNNPLTGREAAAWVAQQQQALVRWHESNPTPPPTPPPPPPPPHDFHTQDLQQLPELVQDCFPLRVVHPPFAGLKEYKATTGMLALGKYWRSSTDFQGASDIMKKQLILNAKRSIKMSQMDLISAWKKNWSDHVVCQWVLEALLANKSLKVEVVVSPLDAGAGAEGDQYSFGSGAVRTFDLLKYYMTHDVATDAVLPDPGGARKEALKRLFVAPFYYTNLVPPGDNIEGDTYKWPNLPKEGYTATLKQPPLSEEPPKHGVIGSAAMSVLNASGYIYNKVPSAPGNHAKLMIVDDEAYVVGSDNLYPGSLAEFDYLIEGPDAVSELLKVYWEPLWRYAGPHARTLDNDPPAPAFRLGPAGAPGTTFDDTSSKQRISSIDVYHGEIVDGIRATHADGKVDPLRGGNGVPADSARKTTVTFDVTDPLVGVSGEWGTWYGGRYITKIQFHRRSGAVSAVYGTGRSATNVQRFDLQAPSPQSQEVTGFFGAVAAADNNKAHCLAAIGFVVQ
ncbi:phospholipase D/Transphosphatidylase [Catenulispora acidiphila DSM 44928]|uniref:Phospholipase D/Transphosphatidylase n=1 Tax=Catenulispora acidiphila (strain DSM 44928 / JCM 14897 / NBRC 102108 / NRRL B-24433 / ID139908) TaxID=479433 RepID=C7QGD8_CATAD|nr:phospholipase D [Catenulispora acidiphila]ACU72983.1 phospholipase D/Transphosphatidylase [Catenulispora acidiphila DSM 44928]